MPTKKKAARHEAGGLTMGLTGRSVASVKAILGGGPWVQFVSFLVGPGMNQVTAAAARAGISWVVLNREVS